MKLTGYTCGNYDILFQNDIDGFVKDLKRYLNTIEVSWATQIRYTNVNAGNIFHNLHYLYEGYSVADLKGYPGIRNHASYFGYTMDILSRIEISDLYINPKRRGGILCRQLQQYAEENYGVRISCIKS